ncbi:MAG: aminotransferase class I/II-fold pyridoxal phosphate-dependent enzyme [Phycisphaerales bacterium]|nr:aminotransferase class I/II-fold pyridoxal phosphate-dependent enzyme [Phycisphaerales bacterium]
MTVPGGPSPPTPSGAAPSARARRFDAAQLRLDTWNEAQYQTNWLHEAHRTGIDRDEPRAKVQATIETLRSLEMYWAFPGSDSVEELARLFAKGEHERLASRAAWMTRQLVSEAHRERGGAPSETEREEGSAARREDRDLSTDRRHGRRPYFELLIVGGLDAEERADYRRLLQAARRDDDEFVYDLVFAPTFQDAVIACQVNPAIQAAALRYSYPFGTANTNDIFRRSLEFIAAENPARTYGLARSFTLAELLQRLRPELDLYLVTDASLEEVAEFSGKVFSRTFHRHDTHLDLHQSVLRGVRARYETPFFDALRRYSAKPTGVFHALPVSRGKSVNNSHWIRDFGRFYGANLFLAETSSTSGGLDSLLQPTGPIKKAQEAAARAFGARKTFFVTNGTSTANKIVMQALVRPDDIVLLSRDCHKSHHYALLLAGAQPVYLDPYSLPEYSIYGGVTLDNIKRTLLRLRASGKLERVRMLLLTNCTFDGVTYEPERVMAEVLAIKPDMIFLWDEAWYAFAGFNPMLRRRTAMGCAARLRASLKAPDAQGRHDAWRSGFEARAGSDEDAWAGERLIPDPSRARVRVYATHSTHKTLTALRQGSMIHVFDQDFDSKARDAFDDAFMTHTSTSPNYQILASLDVGRRQVELEGYELVQRSIGLAMSLRRSVYEHPQIKKWFTVLRPADVIPASHRASGIEFYYDPAKGWARMDEAFRADEFALDPTRVTVHVGRTGMDGAEFRQLLMDRFDIQINKTSRNTALFMTNIGMTRGDVAHLVECLAKVAQELDEKVAGMSGAERRAFDRRVESLTRQVPPLPDFGRFHARFASDPTGATREGDMRSAFFMTYDEANCEHVRLDVTALDLVDSGRELVSAAFITPYPPGFPVLVPGQVVSRGILEYLLAVDVKEVHGLKPGLGLRVFTEQALAAPGGPGPCGGAVPAMAQEGRR